MCRMFLAAGEPSAVEVSFSQLFPLLAEASKNDPYLESALRKFGLPAQGSHPDGWGMAWVDENGMGMKKEMRPVWEAEARISLSGDWSAAIAHSRAALGMPVNLFSTHPIHAYLGKDVLIFHNGLFDKERLGGGEYSDTILFARYLEKKPELLDDLDLLLDEMERIVKTAGNLFMLIGNKEAVAVSFFRDLGKEAEDYYSLFFRERENAIEIASSTIAKISGEEWERMENKSWMRFRKGKVERGGPGRA